MATLAKLIVSIGANTAEFESNLKKASTQLKGFSNDVKLLSPGFDAIGRAIKVVGTAIIGAFVAGGTAALASGQIIEKYRMSLTTLMGSSKAAGEAVASALNLASKTPFSDDQLLAATVALTKFGQDAKTVLPQVADMAAATNGDVEAAAAAFGGFLQGRVKALASYGITKAAVLAEGAATEQGIQIANQKGTIINEAAYSAALLSLMDKRFKAGAELQATSLGGLIKGMKDTGEDILRTIAGFADDGTVRAGSLFDFVKQGITAVLAKVEEWKANGSLQRWATDVGNAIMVFFNGAKTVFEWLVNIADFIGQHWQPLVAIIGGVVGAFLAFKGVETYVTLAATAIKLFGSAASIAALGPIALIIGAVATLAAGVVYLIEKLNQERALLNSLTMEGMAEYDRVTNVTGTQMTDAGQDPTAWYASRVAGHQKYVDAIKQQNDQLARDALASRNATSAAYAKEQQDEYAKTVATNAATVALDTALANDIYKLTHTKLLNDLYVIDTKAKADLAAGKNEVQVAEWVKVSKIAAYKEAADASAKLTEAATKKTAEEAVKILGINADLNDQIYKLSHTTVEGQIYDLAKARDAAIAAGGSKLAAEKVYALEVAKVEKEAADKVAAAWETANDKQVQDVKDTYDEYIAALASYADKQKDVQGALTQAIIDNYGVQEDAAVSALEKERDTAIDTINDQIDARNRQLETTLGNISKEKDAWMSFYDKDISELQATHAAEQRVETLAGLRGDIATATLAVQTAETPEDKARADKDLLRAQKALNKELADEAYNDKLDSLRKLKATASDFWDAQTETAKTVAKSDIDTLKDQASAVDKQYNDPETGMIASAKKFFGNLMLERNADAEAEKLLAGTTQGEIISMLRGRLGEWAQLGTQIGDSLYSGLQGAIAALNTSITATLPTAPISEGGGGISLKAHAAGGYFTTSHIAVIAENGPEWVVPQSRVPEFVGKMTGGNSDTLLNELTYQVKQLQGTVHQMGAATVTAIRG
jgi:hypothetical protein